MNGPELAAHVGVTYKRIDHWTRQGYLRPEEATPGTGHQRSYSATEVFVARRIWALVEAGVTPATAAQIARGDAAAVLRLRRALEAAA